jgi:catechol 2,3-dioxygenase-like lactoylglutathione lyase family enzyme
MRLESVYPIVVTVRVMECRDFYRRWFGLEPLFEASWFVLLARSDGAAAIAFMTPDHPSAPPGPDAFNGKGMCLEFQVADAQAEYDRFVGDGAPLVLSLRDEPFGQRRFGLFDPPVSGSTLSSRSIPRPDGGTNIGSASWRSPARACRS